MSGFYHNNLTRPQGTMMLCVRVFIFCWSCGYGSAAAWGDDGLHSKSQTDVPNVPRESGAAAGLTADPVVGTLEGLQFEGVSGQLLSVEELMAASLPLIRRPEDGAYRAARIGEASDSTGELIPLKDISAANRRVFTASALKGLLDAITRAYTQRGYGAIRIYVTQNDIAALAQPGSTGVLVIRVIEGRVVRVNCQAVGKSPVSDPNDGLRRRIQDQSPLKPGDPLRVEILQAYVDALNRHPGRRVDVALAPGREAGELELNYLIAEAGQPMLYAEVSNTGTAQSHPCRQQYGVVHYNLTRADDIFYANYTTDWFDDIHGIGWGYERPLSPSGRWRGKLNGSHSRHQASEFGLLDREFEGRNNNVGGEIAWNFWQKGNFFADIFAGMEYHRVHTINRITGTDIHSGFLLPALGLRAERRTQSSTLNAQTNVQFNLPDLAGTPPEGINSLDLLGRMGVHRDWTIWRGEISYSMYFEPPGGRGKHPDSEGTKAHEIFTSARGQIVLDGKRVPPSFLQTLGGFHTVRGYPEAINSGDNAILGTMEYRYHWPRTLAPSAKAPVIAGKPFHVAPPYPMGLPDWDLVLRGFCDLGWIKHNQTSTTVNFNQGFNDMRSPFEEDDFLVGTGVGVELSVRSHVRLRADWGWALEDVDYNNQHVSAGSSRLHVSFSVMY